MVTTAIVYRRVLSILMTISLCNRQRRPTDLRWQRFFKTVLRDKQARPFTKLAAERSRAPNPNGVDEGSDLTDL